MSEIEVVVDMKVLINENAPLRIDVVVDVLYEHCSFCSLRLCVDQFSIMVIHVLRVTLFHVR
jgi:hypothetical protein